MALAVTLIEKAVTRKVDSRSTAAEGDEMVIVFGAVPAPGAEEAPPMRLDEQPPDEHIVQRGDTLSSIALQRLGSASLAAELARINKLADPDHLVPGEHLRLR